MELSRQEYPALLTTLQPGQAVHVLSERSKTIGKINSDVADWLAERRRVEEAYVSGLRRLAGRQLESNSQLGVFKTPWQSLVRSCESIADSHESFSRRISADVEKPLRDYATKNNDMVGVEKVQGNLSSLARDVDEAQKKSDKLLAKGNKADTSKLSGALSGVQEAQQQWESQAPYVFEQLQALDEGRVNHLRDCLTQLQTLQTDQLERSRVVVASSLEAILNIDTTEEISAFVARTTGAAPSLPGATAAGAAAASRRMSRHSTNSAQGPPPTSSSSAAPPVPAVPQDLPQPRRPISSHRRAADDEDEARDRMPETPKKGGLGGLRRLGTVMSRRKDNKTSPGPKKEKEKPSRNPLRRGQSNRNTMYQLGSPVASETELAETRSRASAPSQDPPRDEAPILPRNPSATNGLPIASAVAASVGSPPAAQANGSAEIPPAAAEKQPEQSPAPASEPVTQSAKTAEAVNAMDQALAEASGTNEGDQLLNVNIKNEPIPEEDSDAAKAFFDTANMLRAGAQPPQRKLGTVRGRRDVRNTIFVPTGTSLEAAGIAMDSSTSLPSDGVRTQQLTPNLTGTSTRSEDNRNAADAISIRSAHSLSSVGPSAIKHPDMTQPGLNASVVETVSAWFAEGRVTKATAIGEMAFVYNGESSGSEAVRLENFPVLEKVAPNPTFIKQLPDKSGEYSVDLSQISRTQVAFKYQLHLEEGNLASYAPVLLNPMWRVEPTQISVILHYSFNPVFAGGTRKNVSLQNAVLIINVEDAKVTGCQSKPAGTFSREKGMIYWRLGDVVLGEGGEGMGKLIARFSTESQAKPGTVEARWEIGGEHASELGSGLGVSVGSGAAAAAAAAAGGPRKEGENDPFADESAAAAAYKALPVARKLTSGRYVAN